MLLPLKTRDKSINFCGTTQIDDKSPALLRTTMRVLLVTARNPVSAYFPKRFRAALAGPFRIRIAAALSPPAALFAHVWKLTFPAQRFTVLNCGYFSTVFFGCQVIFPKIFGEGLDVPPRDTSPLRGGGCLLPPITRRYEKHRVPLPRRLLFPEGKPGTAVRSLPAPGR